jgi:hypothetical protein
MAERDSNAPLESIRRIKIKDLKVTPLGEELVNSEAMRPYLSYAIAELTVSAQAMQDSGAIIKNLPLEQRYIWRVLRALESGFADFDSYSIKLDLPHLDDVLKREMIEELTLRLQQLVIPSRTLKGECRPFTDPPATAAAICRSSLAIL